MHLPSFSGEGREKLKQKGSKLRRKIVWHWQWRDWKLDAAGMKGRRMRRWYLERQSRQ